MILPTGRSHNTEKMMMRRRREMILKTAKPSASYSSEKGAGTTAKLPSFRGNPFLARKKRSNPL